MKTSAFAGLTNDQVKKIHLSVKDNDLKTVVDSLAGVEDPLDAPKRA